MLSDIEIKKVDDMWYVYLGNSGAVFMKCKTESGIYKKMYKWLSSQSR